MRSYVPEPDRGPRDWEGKAAERDAVYANRRQVRGWRGKRLLKRRGEYLERTLAHAYETGGMRRLHLRGRDNILKRLLVHVGGFNLSLIIRKDGRHGDVSGQAGAIGGRLRMEKRAGVARGAWGETPQADAGDCGAVEAKGRHGKREICREAFTTGCYRPTRTV